LKIISADSAAAILDANYKPLLHVASVAVLVEPPYREPSLRIAEPIFRAVDEGFDVVVHEAELCRSLLDKVQADVVHLDMTLGGIPVEELSPVELTNLRASVKGRQNILRILPRLRRIAGEIKRLHGIDMLAIGKESVPVRIAELTAGSEAVLFAAQRVLDEKKSGLLGLPLNCVPRILDNRIYMHSLIPNEHDVRGFSVDSMGVLTKVKFVETLNPIARGFRVLKISPKN
jgi:hypothetical protein